jgi:Protein of unknown function (DUF4239)
MPIEFLVSLSSIGIFAVVFFCVSVVSMFLLAIMETPQIRQISQQLSQMTTAVVTVSGAIFALSVAFLANSVWASEDKARESIYAEARAIRVIETYIEAMTSPLQSKLSDIVDLYAMRVKAEWPGSGEEAVEPTAEQALSMMYAAVLRDPGQGDTARTLHQRLLVELDALSMAREQRLAMEQDVVSPGQWTLVIGLGVMLLLTVAISHAHYNLARRVSLCVLTISLSIMIYVIVLHHSPFVGPHAQTPDQILRAAGVSQ